MELRHLRYFVAVAEELHFGKAAERLSIAQPPLSMQIQQFERELGFALFLRTQRHVELTAAGKALLDDAREILASADRAVASARRVAQGQAGRLAIGFVGTATYSFLPAVLSAFHREHPDVELVLRELVSARQADALHARRIDIGLARPPLHEAGIERVPLVREALVAVLPDAHPLARRGELALSELASEPFVLFPSYPRPSYAESVVSVCRSAGFRPRVVQETAEIHTAVSLVSAGLGVTIVPESVQKAHREGVAYVRFESPQPMTELAAAYRIGEISPVVHAFVALAQAVA